MNKRNLAIVIPAYKQSFLDRTIKSIANQTCKDFTLYIGNDGSPYDLYSIISKYESEINIRYKYFNTNVGLTNLVSHWHRCIDMTEEEEWIWLFSDDDLMEKNCVECFYKMQNLNSNSNLFHFNIVTINDKDKLINPGIIFPNIMSIDEFISQRFRSKIKSYVVEYIFRKSAFEFEGRFEQFDLGWCSDDATWIKMAKLGIQTIPDAKVFWRISNENITPNNNDANLAIRKINALLKFISWQIDYFEKYSLNDNTSCIVKLLWFLRNVKSYKHVIPWSKQIKFIKQYLTITKEKYLLPCAIIYIMFKNIHNSTKR